MADLRDEYPDAYRDYDRALTTIIGNPEISQLKRYLDQQDKAEVVRADIMRFARENPVSLQVHDEIVLGPEVLAGFERALESMQPLAGRIPGLLFDEIDTARPFVIKPHEKKNG